MDHLRAVAADLDRLEDEHTADAMKEWQVGVFWSRAMVAGGTILNLALLAFAAFLLNRDLRSREQIVLEHEEHANSRHWSKDAPTNYRRCGPPAERRGAGKSCHRAGTPTSSVASWCQRRWMLHGWKSVCRMPTTNSKDAGRDCANCSMTV